MYDVKYLLCMLKKGGIQYNINMMMKIHVKEGILK